MPVAEGKTSSQSSRSFLLRCDNTIRLILHTKTRSPRDDVIHVRCYPSEAEMEMCWDFMIIFDSLLISGCEEKKKTLRCERQISVG